MSHFPKRRHLTFEPNFQIHSEIQDLNLAQGPSTSSSPLSSLVLPGTREEEEEKKEEEEKEEMEEEEKEEKEGMEQEEEEEGVEMEQEEEKEEEEKEGKQGKEQEEEEEWVEIKQEEEKEEEEKQQEKEGEVEQWHAAETPTPPLRPQTLYSFDTLSSTTSINSSVGSIVAQSLERTYASLAKLDAYFLCTHPLEKKVADLVHFMILKYQLRKLITKAEMLKVVIKRRRHKFLPIFQRACKRLEVISGIDVKEVDPTTHSYALVNSLDLTYDEMPSDDRSLPKNGLLMIILGVIFTEGNCAQEKDIWEFLSVIGVYAGIEHFICGDVRKLLTRDWVRENYLEYQWVHDSYPPRYQFLWGPRAHAETSKLKVLEFLVKIKATDPISYSFFYEKALRDERESEQAQARNSSMDGATAMFIAQHESAASPSPTE